MKNTFFSSSIHMLYAVGFRMEIIVLISRIPLSSKCCNSQRGLKSNTTGVKMVAAASCGQEIQGAVC
jgi:hypothetical protein